MLTITTWKTFLRYGLDLMTKEDCAAAVYFLCCEQIRCDASSFNTSTSQVILAKSLWPVKIDVDEYLRSPDKYAEYLENISSSPTANIGELLKMTTCIPCFIFVADFEFNTVLVHVFQKHFYETYGVGSIWLDGMILTGEPNEYVQDDEKVKNAFKDHIKNARQALMQTRGASGAMYKDTRLALLNEMSDADMREYLKKNYQTDTAGLDSSKVYALMHDLFIDETNGPGQDNLKTAIQHKYKNRKKNKS